MNADVKRNDIPLKSPIKMPLEMKKKLSFFQDFLDFRNFFEKNIFILSDIYTLVFDLVDVDSYLCLSKPNKLYWHLKICMYFPTIISRIRPFESRVQRNLELLE